MSAKRVYTIKCDGPICTNEIVTKIAFVMDARTIAKNKGWWKIGEQTERALDFCTAACEGMYNERIHS